MEFYTKQGYLSFNQEEASEWAAVRKEVNEFTIDNIFHNWEA